MAKTSYFELVGNMLAGKCDRITIHDAREILKELRIRPFESERKKHRRAESKHTLYMTVIGSNEYTVSLSGDGIINAGSPTFANLVTFFRAIQDHDSTRFEVLKPSHLQGVDSNWRETEELRSQEPPVNEIN